jgi:prefoldin beta subunit
MDLKTESDNKIQELQFLEQNLQAVMMQKQAFQLELSETENAIKEIENTNQEIYKIVGNIMIKSSKENLLKELKEKNDLLSLRLKSIDSQEKELMKNSEKLRQDVLSKIKK